jgi:hypothetical protein
MIGSGISAANALGDHLPVVVGEMREASDAGHVAGPVNPRRRFQGRRVDFQPAALGPRQTGAVPRLEIGATSRGDE